jgi:4-aminobutyrate aminotransferase
MDIDIIELTRKHESAAVNTFGMGIDPPIFIKGQSASLWTEDGRRFIDLVSGSAVSNLGHGNSHQIEAIKAEMESGILHTGTRLPSKARAELYQELSRIFPEELDTIHLANSGSEAVEISLKIAQYVTGRTDIFSFYGGYHGRTVGSLSVTSTKRIRKPFLPLFNKVHFFPYPYVFRPPLPGCDGNNISDFCLEYLRQALLNPVSGIQDPCALIVEAVQGVSGVIIPPHGFLKGIREICNEFGILLIVDEIWNGFGRTGQWFAFQHENIVPDIVTFGKALSGSLPLAGAISKEQVLKSWPSGMHTSTFQGNPLACAAAMSNIRQIKEEKILKYVRDKIEPMIKERLDELGSIPGVGEIRVIGALAGIELVGENGQPNAKAAKKAQVRCMDKQVLVYSAGWYSNVIMLVPPLVITLNELDESLSKVISVIKSLS